MRRLLLLVALLAPALMPGTGYAVGQSSSCSGTLPQQTTCSAGNVSFPTSSYSILYWTATAPGTVARSQVRTQWSSGSRTSTCDELGGILASCSFTGPATPFGASGAVSVTMSALPPAPAPVGTLWMGGVEIGGLNKVAGVAYVFLPAPGVELASFAVPASTSQVTIRLHDLGGSAGALYEFLNASGSTLSFGFVCNVATVSVSSGAARVRLNAAPNGSCLVPTSGVATVVFS